VIVITGTGDHLRPVRPITITGMRSREPATNLLLANWPYTIFVIMPTNRRQMNTPVEAAAAETRRMVRWWGVLHAGRSSLGLVATLIFLWAQR